ncbi:metallophosphoesterase family protein [Mesorhizobium sp. LNJC403B00]|uniref:metallophosphoesterase family protein n=1 Tax=unclassified Mesorhizobium TaxID=325217 RepID=UPI0003CF1622|nr:metallophosphoesterase family protein [Mesorhizobium sp. LNJC403B00]ESX88825.1 metallophosphoesterase [Mesorhizobium sp. LNJC403B00]
MRLAVLSDIHGNLRALEAVHAQIKDASPDIIVNLGDCLSGPLWPEETAQYLMAQNWPTVRGNHDRVLVEPPASGLEDVDAFTHQRLSQASLTWLSALPVTLSPTPDILLCHGSPSDDNVFLLEEDGGSHFHPSNEKQIRHKLGSAGAGLTLCGHTHTPRVVRLSDNRTILNPGSVGVQAFPGLTVTGSPHARYALATRKDGQWSFSHHVVNYDWTEASSRATATGFDSWAHGLLTGYAANSL